MKLLHSESTRLDAVNTRFIYKNPFYTDDIYMSGNFYGEGDKLLMTNSGGGFPVSVWGNTYFVDYANGNDEFNGKSPTKSFKTLSRAYNMATTNQYDVINVLGYSAVTETSMITWAKSRIIVNGVGTLGRQIQQGARIYMGVTGVATDLAPVLVTGTRNSFLGIKAENASTTDESLYGWIDNGEGTYYENFMSCKTAGLDDAGHAHFWLAGDACSGKNLTFGHSTLQSSAAGYGLLIDAKSGGGADHVKELMWENVRVNMSVASGVASTSAMIKIADNSAMLFTNTIDRFRGYHFIAPSGGASMTDAVLAAASTTAGYLYLIDPVFIGCTGVGGGAGYGVKIAVSGNAPDPNGGLATDLTD